MKSQSEVIADIKALLQRIKESQEEENASNQHNTNQQQPTGDTTRNME